MKENGYIREHRSLLDWEWFKDPFTAHLWEYLRLSANWRDAAYKGHSVKRGQLVVSYASMAEDTGLSIQNVRTAINHLKKTGEITAKAFRGFSIVTITNYEKYQSDTPVYACPLVNNIASEQAIDKGTAEKNLHADELVTNVQEADNQQATNIQVTHDQQADNTQVTNSQQTANIELTTIEKRKKGKREKESIPPLPPNASERFSKTLLPILEEWLAYKHERREDYKPTGLRNMLSEIENRVSRHGDEAVAKLIRLCMANNWKGIIWDRIEQTNNTPATGYKTDRFSEPQMEAWDQEWIERVKEDAEKRKDINGEHGE